MFVQTLQDEGIKITDGVKRVEDQMSLALGLLLCYEIGDRVEKFQNALQNSVNNLTLRHRQLPRYDAKMFLDQEGPIMKELNSTLILQEREKIHKLVMSFVAIAMVGDSVKEKGGTKGK